MPEDQLEDQAIQLDAQNFVNWSKAKAKPYRWDPADFHQELFPWTKETRSIFNQGNILFWVRGFEENDSFPSSFSTSTTRRGWIRAFEENLGKSSGSIPTIVSFVWQSMESMLDSRRRSKNNFQYCIDDSGTIVSFRFLQGHSGRNLIDFFSAGQCCDSERILQKYLPHWMSTQSSLYHQLWIHPRGKNSSKKRTTSFLFVEPLDKSHKNPDDIDFKVTSCTIRAQCIAETSRRGKLGWHLFRDSERIEILSKSMERNYLSGNTSSLSYSKSC